MKNRSEMSSADRLEELSITREELYNNVGMYSDLIVPRVPYTIEEALEALKDGEVETIKYTFKKKKFLLRYNEERSYFEWSNFKNRYWNVCEYSYLRMKTWEDIGIYEEEFKDKKEFDDFWGDITGYGIKKKLKDLDIDCIFEYEITEQKIYFFVKKNKDEKKIKKHIFPHISGLIDCEIVNINNIIYKGSNEQ